MTVLDVPTPASPSDTPSTASDQALSTPTRNVGDSERIASVAAGSILAVLGLTRGSLGGLIVAGIGGGLLLRGASGHCGMYQAMGVDTATVDDAEAEIAAHGIHVEQSCLIGKPAAELYAFWRDFTNLPRFMSHLEKVEILDGGRSRWTAKAPRIAGGHVTWDAEITHDQAGELIAWRSLPGSQVTTVGEIRFAAAPGTRGTEVRVRMDYVPPAGRVGHWVATLFGENPRRQMHDDLRAFRQLMELGEIPTTVGQPRGTCLGHGKRSST